MEKSHETDVFLKGIVETLERYVKEALKRIKDMEKFDGIWRPNANHNIDQPLTDVVQYYLEVALKSAKVIKRATVGVASPPTEADGKLWLFNPKKNKDIFCAGLYYLHNGKIGVKWWNEEESIWEASLLSEFTPPKEH